MTLAILTTEQIAVSIAGAVILTLLWFAAGMYERHQNREWHLEDEDQYVISSLYEFKKDRD